jgi:16S rRNA (guanine(966)-N(2))-methyltransferase RsmD
MRVIGGTRKGRKLVSFKCPSIRPTADKVREAVFNVLERGGPFNKVLDLFAGTGAMGIEALSRGSGQAVFVERDGAAVSVIRKNLRACGFEEKARVLKRDAISSIRYLCRRGERFDLAFIDAPYGEGTLTVATLKAVADKGLLDPDAPNPMVVCETSKRAPAINLTELKGLEQVRKKLYGDTMVYFFKAS